MSNRYAVILAAGKGTRMKSKLHKILHPVCGKPMVQHVVDQVKKLSCEEIVTIVGYGAEKVEEQLTGQVKFAMQHDQLGTAHAVEQAAPVLEDKEGTTIVLCGDTPLITSETMNELINHHEKANAKVTILTAQAENPFGYGRIVRDSDGTVAKIVEHKDANDEEQKIKEINTGTYCFDNKALFAAIKKVDNNNSQGEYYLPDVIEILKGSKEVVSAYQTTNFDETLGVNDRVALAKAEVLLKKRINERHMRNGVSIIDPDNTYISAEVVIGQDTVLYPGTSIMGNSVIGNDCVIGPNTEIVNCSIGNSNEIKQSVITQSEIGNGVNIGPFSHIRPLSTIADEVKIGNFVEVKKSTFGKGSKASHLSYLGDADIGENVNIGCGSITVNYDGKNKFLTKVEDGAFIGCNTNLIAPVTVGKEAYVAAGSTITDDVPASALSIARSRQTNKENYVKKN